MQHLENLMYSIYQLHKDHFDLADEHGLHRLLIVQCYLLQDQQAMR